MTNLAIARRWAGITPAQLAEALGSTAQHINNMERERTPIGKNSVRKLAEVLDVSEAWLLGVPQKLAVYDPNSSDVFFCPIVREEEIDGYGILYHVYFDESGDVFPVIDGSDHIQFTPMDWFSPYNARNVSEIPETDWQDSRGTPGIKLHDGLPRVIM